MIRAITAPNRRPSTPPVTLGKLLPRNTPPTRSRRVGWGTSTRLAWFLVDARSSGRTILGLALRWRRPLAEASEVRWISAVVFFTGVPPESARALHPEIHRRDG